MKLAIEVMKLKCSKCGKIEYRGRDDGLARKGCIDCRDGLTMEKTGLVSEAEFEEF